MVDMAATRWQIEGWLKEAQAEGATHMLVKCDNFGDPMGDCCYPVPVMAHQNVREVEAEPGRVMEVYSLTGKHTIEKQMGENRAFHYD
jgi:hypothetical protein